MSYTFSASLLDTSVVVKWSVSEEDSDIAQGLRQAHIRDDLQLYAPDILLMELANALRYSPVVSPEEITPALRLLYDLEITVIAFSLGTLSSSVSLSLDHDLAVYDAYFLALAQELEIPLITADRKMLSRLVGVSGVLDLKNI